MTGQPLIHLEGIVKTFGPFTALNGVDLDVYPGEVLALLGDNGAGKSTLIKVMSGVHQPNGGRILVEGKPVHFRSPRDAAASRAKEVDGKPKAKRVRKSGGSDATDG